MKNQKISYLIIGIIVFVGYMVLGPGGNFLKKQNQSLPSPVTTAANAFNNWKIYTNTKLGIEFKYPSELRLQETKDSVRILRNTGYLFDVKRIDTDDDVVSWWSKVSKDYAPYVLSKTQFNNKLAYYFKQDTKEVQTPMDMYAIKMNGYILNISYEVPFNLDLYPNNTNKETYKIANEKFAKTDQKIIDQIFSTVKFITSAQSDKAIKILQENKSIQYIQGVISNNGRKAYLEPWNEKDDIVEISLIEGGFPDQHTTRIDTFLVNVKTGEILIDDMVNNKKISLKDWGKTITQRFPDYGPQKTATVLVQDGSNYRPPFDPNLYQLEISKSEHLFAKSDLVDLKKYLGKNVEVKYREVIGVIMGEQQLVTVDSIK